MGIGSDDNNFYFFWDSVGEFQWRCDTGAPVRGAPIVDTAATGDVIFDSESGLVYLLNRNGVERSTFSTGGAVHPSLVTTADDSFLVGECGNLNTLHVMMRRRHYAITSSACLPFRSC